MIYTCSFHFFFDPRSTLESFQEFHSCLQNFVFVIIKFQLLLASFSFQFVYLFWLFKCCDLGTQARRKINWHKPAPRSSQGLCGSGLAHTPSGRTLVTLRSLPFQSASCDSSRGSGKSPEPRLRSFPDSEDGRLDSRLSSRKPSLQGCPPSFSP